MLAHIKRGPSKLLGASNRGLLAIAITPAASNHSITHNNMIFHGIRQYIANTSFFTLCEARTLKQILFPQLLCYIDIFYSLCLLIYTLLHNRVLSIYCRNGRCGVKCFWSQRWSLMTKAYPKFHFLIHNLQE